MHKNIRLDRMQKLQLLPGTTRDINDPISHLHVIITSNRKKKETQISENL